MAETAHHEAHVGPSVRTYLIIGVALSVFTTVSFVVNSMVRGQTLTAETGFIIIMAVAICKAALVGAYFMHLKFDWGKLYFMIVPAFILGAMLAFVLLPDIVLAWVH
jgi:cytochrome c oxidase subunit 4